MDQHRLWIKQFYADKIRLVCAGKLEMEALSTELADKIADLEDERIKDPLTKVFNRRYLQESLDYELRTERHYGHKVGVFMMDLDHFKSINDEEPDGHAAGDRALMTFVNIASKVLGDLAIFGRWGGEEFLVIIPDANTEKLEMLAEDIRAKTQTDLAALAKLTREQVTVSIGVAMTHNGEKPEAVIELADERLYKAKASGRNRVVFS